MFSFLNIYKSFLSSVINVIFFCPLPTSTLVELRASAFIYIPEGCFRGISLLKVSCLNLLSVVYANFHSTPLTCHKQDHVRYASKYELRIVLK